MKIFLIIFTLFVVGILIASLVIFALTSYGDAVTRYFEEAHEEL